MPHAGLMDENILGKEAGLLMRSKLHIRSGKRRLRQGKISAGLLTLYDALLAALDWYVASSQRKNLLQINDNENMNNERDVLAVLVRSKVIDGSFDFEAFDSLIERAIKEEILYYDYSELLAGIESMMEQLGVMPFDEAELPSEDPSTF